MSLSFSSLFACVFLGNFNSFCAVQESLLLLVTTGVSGIPEIALKWPLSSAVLLNVGLVHSGDFSSKALGRAPTNVFSRSFLFVKGACVFACSLLKEGPPKCVTFRPYLTCISLSCSFQEIHSKSFCHLN